MHMDYLTRIDPLCCEVSATSQISGLHYKPLPRDPPSIRLIRVLPDLRDGLLVCQTRSVSLEASKD